MAYNNISGTVFSPGTLIAPLDAIISGNLSTSDGASIINVPRLNNAVNNAILTNVDGDFNTLTCESNLTFDGETLNIVGDLTASAGLSASFLYGDGRHLTNINVGGVKFPRRSVTSNYTIALTDYFIAADSTGGTFQVTLPSADSTLDGQTFVVKDEGGNANTNNITIAAPGGDTIDGKNSVVLESPYASIQLYCNGNNKYFIF